MRPLDELAHPRDALVVVARGWFATLVFPVSGDAFFGDTVHFLSADLDLKRLPGMNDGGVQRLIKVRARHGDVIFETARDWPPDVVHYAERSVTVSLSVRDYADGEQVIYLFETALLPQNFAV